MKQGNNWGTGVLITDKANKILVGLRTDTKDWATPGGKVNLGETPLEGIIRETREESNLKINPKYIDVKVGAFKNKKVWCSFLFLAKGVSGKVIPQKSEFKEFKWVTKEELKKLKLFRPTKMMISIFEKKGIL